MENETKGKTEVNDVKEIKDVKDYKDAKIKLTSIDTASRKAIRSTLRSSPRTAIRMWTRVP